MQVPGYVLYIRKLFISMFMKTECKMKPKQNGNVKIITYKINLSSVYVYSLS